MAKVNLMTQAEYAKHRGCSAVAVHKAVKAGRISLIGDKIDPEVADIQWERNTRARAKNVKPATPAAPASTPAAGDGTPDLVDAAAAAAATPEVPVDTGAGDGDRQQDDPRYMESRSSREEAAARREWLKLKEEEGELVRIDQVRAELAARLAPVREGLLQIPARLAPILAAQSDPARIQTQLEVEIHTILAPLAKLMPPQPTSESQA